MITMIDETGNKYGRLTVLERANYIGNQPAWKCQCECGNIKITTGKILRAGRCKSCGCLGNGRERDRDVVYMITLNKLKCRAKKKELDFNLDIDDVKRLSHDNCVYCGNPPILVKTVVDNRNKEKIQAQLAINGIDRVDNNKGYTKDNSVSCCNGCNIAKGTLTVDEFKVNIIRIFNHLNLKNE